MFCLFVDRTRQQPPHQDEDVDSEDDDDDADEDDEEVEAEERPVLPNLSEQLRLDGLWDTLSTCLLQLADTPDHHAVLMLQVSCLVYCRYRKPSFMILSM